jgi:hypothetical protein
MKTFRSRYIRRVLVPVMAVSVLSACSGWKHQEMAPSQVVTEKQPDRVLLTMLDGDRIELVDPILTDGVILGHPVDPYNQVYGVLRSDTLRVVADSVARIEIGGASAGGKVLAVVLVFGILGFVIALNVDWELGCCQ